MVNEDVDRGHWIYNNEVKYCLDNDSQFVEELKTFERKVWDNGNRAIFSYYYDNLTEEYCITADVYNKVDIDIDAYVKSGFPVHDDYYYALNILDTDFMNTVLLVLLVSAVLTFLCGISLLSRTAYAFGFCIHSAENEKYD